MRRLKAAIDIHKAPTYPSATAIGTNLVETKDNISTDVSQLRSIAHHKIPQNIPQNSNTKLLGCSAYRSRRKIKRFFK